MRSWLVGALLAALHGGAAADASRDDAHGPTRELDLDIGVQTRSYAERGFDGQSSFQPSASALFRARLSWNDEQDLLTFAPFARWDAEDDERTHADLRELYYTHVGDGWDLHAGIRQVFWGVTEFKHLVDVINQTDLVENIDGEDKLGQPMVNLSLVRDWGILDFFVLPGFRERSFPGEDGRLRHALPVNEGGATYESGAGRHRVDAAVRWAQHTGPLDIALYQFHGTSRDPLLVPTMRTDGELRLRPHYEVIDQTGLEAQLIVDDWAFKLEALSRSGYGERHGAAVAGFERTLVGVLGRSDLGIVLEYMFDERGDDAFDTILEHDVALGLRWRRNDEDDTQALLGYIRDTQTGESLVSLEANTRFGERWALLIEARIFAGARDEPVLGDPDNKTSSLQRDDYVQLELTRFF